MATTFYTSRQDMICVPWTELREGAGTYIYRDSWHRDARQIRETCSTMALKEIRTSTTIDVALDAEEALPPDPESLVRSLPIVKEKEQCGEGDFAILKGRIGAVVWIAMETSKVSALEN